MFGSLSLPWLILLFLAAAVAIWLAGIKLSDTTDVLSERLGLGQALGGLILLAIATNLPEIAITFTAAVSHNLGLAIGNILGELSAVMHKAVLEDHPRLAGFQAYVCGVPVMTQAAQREFLAAGLPNDAFFADAFVTRAEVASAGP